MPFGVNDDPPPFRRGIPSASDRPPARIDASSPGLRSASNQRLLQTSVGDLAADKADAAGIKLNPFPASTSPFEQAAQTVEASTGLLQVAQVAFVSVSENLRQMRELALAAARDDLTPQQRARIQEQLQALVRELNEMASQASFNGQPLLDGSAGVAVGPEAPAGSQKAVAIPRSDSAAWFPDGAPQLDSPARARDLLTGIEDALRSVDDTTQRLGAAQQDLTRRLAVERANTEAAAASFPSLGDGVSAREAAVFARKGIITQSSTALLAQANVKSQLVLQLFGPASS